jgi:hypothetical protein
VATDILEAAARAYVRALSNVLQKARTAAVSDPRTEEATPTP